MPTRTVLLNKTPFLISLFTLWVLPVVLVLLFGIFCITFLVICHWVQVSLPLTVTICWVETLHYIPHTHFLCNWPTNVHNRYSEQDTWYSLWCFCTYGSYWLVTRVFILTFLLLDWCFYCCVCDGLSAWFERRWRCVSSVSARLTLRCIALYLSPRFDYNQLFTIAAAQNEWSITSLPNRRQTTTRPQRPRPILKRGVKLGFVIRVVKSKRNPALSPCRGC